MKILIKTLIILFLTVSFSNAENKWSFYTGMFDFSDDGKRANLFGAEYINFNASKDIFLGNIQPVTGAMITADDALYIYTGYQLNQNTFLLWLLPLILFIFGGLLIIRKVSIK